MMADAARKKIIQVPGIGEVLLVKRPGTARLRISVSPRRGVVISMPWMLPYAIAEKFLLSKRQWVAAALERQAGQMHRAAESGRTATVPDDPAELERMREAARAALVPKLLSAAARYGFPFKGRVAIKNNVTNWGSCSSKGNINLNMRLILLPEHLQDPEPRSGLPRPAGLPARRQGERAATGASRMENPLNQSFLLAGFSCLNGE